MKIAVIDDERPARRELIHQILEVLPGSQIGEADSGASALELISSGDFDLLFIDINLNDMEGTTLAAAARRMMPRAQIVFATAYSQYAVKAFELGVNNYILKPFDPERVAPRPGKMPEGSGTLLPGPARRTPGHQLRP